MAAISPTTPSMHQRLAVATRDGLVVPDLHGRFLAGRSVDSIVVDDTGDRMWAIVDGNELHCVEHGTSEVVARLGDGRAGVLGLHHDTVWLGGDDARLWHLRNGRLEPVTTFADAPTHERWSTPWGGPPAIFSMASHDDDLYVNVHVGGILRTSDGGDTWSPTVDLDVDVHQVTAAADGTLWAATGRAGLAESRDRGETWRFHTDGLHATYALAVALSAEGPIVSSSSGHAARDGALHRFDGEGFDRLHDGLPDELDGAVGPRQLTARGTHVAAALPGGLLCTSTDSGRTWTQAAIGLPGARQLAL